MTDNQRVILVSGNNSKWYEQAIFIINKNMPREKIPVDFVAEAEKIINNYYNQSRNLLARPAVSRIDEKPAPVQRVATGQKPKRKNGVDMFLNIVMLLCCIALACAFVMAVRN